MNDSMILLLSLLHVAAIVTVGQSSCPQDCFGGLSLYVVWRPAPLLREEGSGLARINSLYTVARFLLPLIFIYSCIINSLIIIILINHEYGTRRHSA